jgi:hypothetical protein
MYQQQIVSSPPMNIKIEMSPSPLATRLDILAVNPFGLFFSAIWLMIPAIVAIEKITANIIK